MTFREFLIGTLLVIGTAASCRPVLVPGQQFTMDTFTAPAPRERVFDAALAIAQQLNLQVAVIEKASGLIRFENATLSPLQLDQYCTYPLHNPRTNQPEGTFISRSEEYPGSVRGLVTLNILITDHGSTSELSLRGNWTAFFGGSAVLVDSKGTLEKDFRVSLLHALEANGTPPSSRAPLEERLKELESLRQRGLIDRKDYDSKRRQLLEEL